MFISQEVLRDCTWQGLERIVMRLFELDGFESVRLVGQTGDQGADLLAHKNGKRWLIQVKNWHKPVGREAIDRTIEALATYRAQVPVVVSVSGFDAGAREQQRNLLARQIPLQLLDRPALVCKASALNTISASNRTPRAYQEEAIQAIMLALEDGGRPRALLVMATGLGKTFTAAEAIRRMRTQRDMRVLVVAHLNPLVYQLERAFWPCLSPNDETLVWNGIERPPQTALNRAQFVFACKDTVADYLKMGGDLPHFDLIVVDECHHLGGSDYTQLLTVSRAGQQDGPALLGLTATPWRPDGSDLSDALGEPVYSIDMIAGLKRGFLSNVDYRVHTDNIKWNALENMSGVSLTPKGINRTFFIDGWDDAVVRELQRAWSEVVNPRAIVFCGTIDHALTMRDRINARAFAKAEALVSSQGGRAVPAFEKNRTLCDFDAGLVNVVCAVDIFNEGLDVPEVNILVFQRVTHSRRIFIQQLGRGLRLSPGKDRTLVLDFVSDIRRFAADIDLKDELGVATPLNIGERINLPYKVEFRRADEADPDAEAFLRNWLEDVGALQDAGDDAAVLRFPPSWRGSH